MKSILSAVLIYILSVQISSAQWVQVSSGLDNRDVTSLASGTNIIFAGTYNFGVYSSTNNGISWTQTPLNNRYIFSLAVKGNTVFAGTFGNGIYLSTNNGANWVQNSLNGLVIGSFTINDNTIFAGTGNSGVYQSTDNGTTWTQTSLTGLAVYSLASNGENIFAGGYNTSPFGAYFSANNGSTWNQTSLINQNVYSLAVNGNNIFAGTQSPNSGVFYSSNNGANWTQTSLNNRTVISLVVDGFNIYAATGINGVYVSNDNGISWIQRIEGLAVAGDLCLLNNYLFAGTGGSSGSVWRRPLSELTGIQPTTNLIPDQFFLSQNYPNPFNPVTHLGFGISELGFVSLKVYSALGKEVQTLVNENLSPGTYEVEFNGSDLPSGVYFYKIQSGNFSEVKRMFLLK